MKLDGVFRFFDGSYHLLAISDDSNWLLRASIEQFFVPDQMVSCHRMIKTLVFLKFLG